MIKHVFFNFLFLLLSLSVEASVETGLEALAKQAASQGKTAAQQARFYNAVKNVAGTGLLVLGASKVRSSLKGAVKGEAKGVKAGQKHSHATDALSGCDMLKDLQASLTLEEDTRRLLAGITAHTAAQSAIGGEDLGRALLYNITTQTAQFGAKSMAGFIKRHYDPSGNKELGLNYVSHKLAHGISAAGFGGLSAAVLGEDVGRSMLMAGCGAAVGEVLGEGMMKLGLKEGEVIPLREYHTMRERIVYASQGRAWPRACSVRLCTGMMTRLPMA